MLLFVSDLHLVDLPELSTLNTRAFLQRIGQIVRDSAKLGVTKTTLVLLGDIFELLKSETWLDTGIRPWEPFTRDHSAAVSKIFEDIRSANEDFFSGIRHLQAECPTLQIRYVPGNHDRMLNTPAGADARRRFRELLEVNGSESDPFDEVLVDKDHRTIAKHGHEWDPTNRYTSAGAAIGDAVVIEILVRLPRLLRERFELTRNDDFVRMVSDVDNVRPQAPRYLGEWLLACLDSLAEARYDNAKRAVAESLELALHDFSKLRKGATRFESLATLTWWERFLSTAARGCLKAFGALRSSVVLPSGGESVGPYASFAGSDLEVATSGAGGDYSYILCGHTHVPEIVALGQRSKQFSSGVYINTGTWRRVHHATGAGDFVTWDEECAVIIATPAEQKLNLPAYEFRSTARGFET
jgi:UDP-2,3-diacylglucosamine pyrophosphatase LpxH